MIDLSKVVGFDWDDGNSRKSADKHAVSQLEAESVFVHDPLLLQEDAKHSAAERRFYALGQTKAGRLLHVTFTLRADGTLIRVLSARDMSRRDRSSYEKA
ncbi:BrnT family toxin [Rhodopseudomonas palustris]|uniref:BrnT family toxin n=1 Tax=Rhodopseudomonas palustris TaxID=1076 RepID=UPI002ACE38CC|nr:BrnT family toxin [Rhodopseudomonas palustris]WQH01588.1 BrnT family toxin [Rhodopseudomonas palustris]